MSLRGDEGYEMFDGCNNLEGEQGTSLENIAERGITDPDEQINATCACIDT